MHIYLNSATLLFGNRSTSSLKYSLKGLRQEELAARTPFDSFKGYKPVLLDQIHGNTGYRIHDEAQAQIAPYSISGDYLVTTCPKVALTVETADCVPLVLIDEAQPAIALVHAGWRGTQQGVVERALEDLYESGSRPGAIRAFIGPSGRSCCYEVAPEFQDFFPTSSAFRQEHGRLFFDLGVEIHQRLEKMALGVIITDYNECTICNETYCSYRRQGNACPERQVTIVALK